MVGDVSVRPAITARLTQVFIMESNFNLCSCARIYGNFLVMIDAGIARQSAPSSPNVQNLFGLSCA